MGGIILRGNIALIRAVVDGGGACRISDDAGDTAAAHRGDRTIVATTADRAAVQVSDNTADTADTHGLYYAVCVGIRNRCMAVGNIHIRDNILNDRLACRIADYTADIGDTLNIRYVRYVDLGDYVDFTIDGEILDRAAADRTEKALVIALDGHGNV